MSRSVLTRDSPYLAEHHASKAQRMAPPRDLLGWFVREFRAEMPDEIHAGGVWRDWKPLTELSDRKAVGGSLLGSPRYDDGFRRFIEDSPTAEEHAEYEGHEDPTPHFRFPVRAALARLAGRGDPEKDRHAFMGRLLWRIALLDGDWERACATVRIVGPVRWPYVELALARLWARYSIEPSREVDAA